MRGWVSVITGPMYSGKTEALLGRVRRRDHMQKLVQVFRPALDTRTEAVVSRAGTSRMARSIQNSNDLLRLYEAWTPDVVAVDEAQFLDDRLPSLVRTLANDGVEVILAGLDRDFLGRPFGPMAALLVEADEVTKLTAVCFKCKGDASLTQRLVDGRPASASDPLVVVGGMGDEKYEARCRSCWRSA